jgi:coenzyme F420-reducing hydrogenase beta subunit
MGRLAVATALIVACAAGCKKTLHWKNIEDDIAAKVAAKVAPVASVTCPETRVEDGLTFDCVVHFVSGGERQAHVQLVGQAGGMRWMMPPR